MALESFHPAVAGWFTSTFHTPTECQRRAWPHIQAGVPTLIAAPTGSGKTLAAFLCAIDDLVREADRGALGDEVRVLYISPLRALSHDIQCNLEQPLAGIQRNLTAGAAEGTPLIRSAVRTGDTPQTARAAMRRRPPHILVTTPESLYVLLTSRSGRAALESVRTVIVDEVHALVSSKRGAHLALTLERLGRITPRPPTRIGLSATQRPLSTVARFLTGSTDDGTSCRVVDLGHQRQWDLAIELPETPLAPVMSAEASAEVYDRVADLVREHRATLVFVNTRRMAERVSRALAERLAPGEDTAGEAVLAHHGSLSKEKRLDAERRLKAGALKALVATASLELGIDVGEVDLVCQLGSTRSLATLLQRVGRSGHSLRGIPKGRLFPQTRDDLVECLALIDMARRGELDVLVMPVGARDVLAQQIVAECASGSTDAEGLFEMARRAAPYADLERNEFDRIVGMLCDGFTTERGRRGAYVHRDAVNGRLHARRGARLVALTCGGAIPEQGDYEVILEPGGQVIGTVNEDFAIESIPGNVFQLGTSSWRVLRVERQALRVADADGAPPNIPFWFGEAPGRTDACSAAVSRLRSGIAEALAGGETPSAIAYGLCTDLGVGESAAVQAVDYLAGAFGMLGALPTLQTLILERFFDDSGGMQLVLHSPFGARLNRAWGLALRKRFCRRFNFELQAAATDDAIVISLGVVHSFELGDVWSFLNPATVREVLAQAVLDAPMFPIRWRWVVTCALAVQRFRNGRRVPPQLQRMAAEDLVALTFPDQLACQENITGQREIPDHPLVAQALEDCLTEAMDIVRLERVLEAIRDGAIQVINRDLTEPSPLAAEILNANPYAFLDDAPLEERRTRAVQQRRWLDPAAAQGVGRLDERAIDRVLEELAPQPRDIEELHDALSVFGYLKPAEAQAARPKCDAGAAGPPAAPDGGQLGLVWDDRRPDHFADLERAGRAVPLVPGDRAGPWIAIERAPEFCAAQPGFQPPPGAVVPAEFARVSWDAEDALESIVKSRLEFAGPVTAGTLAADLGLPPAAVTRALARCEAAGFALRGRFRGALAEDQWCERRILARVARTTVNRLRAEIEPVTLEVFSRFLLRWQRLTTAERGEGGAALGEVVAQLAGFQAPAAAWEKEILVRRIHAYDPALLDALTLAGEVAWLPAARARGAGVRLVGASGVVLAPRRAADLWRSGGEAFVAEGETDSETAAAEIAARLAGCGPTFAADLVGSGLTREQVAAGLVRLVAAGAVHADGFAGLRAVVACSGDPGEGKRAREVFAQLERSGRWSLIRLREGGEGDADARAEAFARQLLERYGVVFRQLAVRESGLPPWRDLLRAFRRLELRGDVRGGRFVARISGEQFALPEAVSGLRSARTAPRDPELVAVSAVDPANTYALFDLAPAVPNVTGNRIVFIDGIPAAARTGGEIATFRALDNDTVIKVRTMLLSESSARYSGSAPARRRRPRSAVAGLKQAR